jgi:hypothetical protein
MIVQGIGTYQRPYSYYVLANHENKVLIWQPCIYMVIKKSFEVIVVPTSQISCPSYKPTQFLMALPHGFNHGFSMVVTHGGKKQGMVKARVVI